MNENAFQAPSSRGIRPQPDSAGADAGARALTVAMLVVAVVAFGVYWLTAVLLDVRRAAGHFGADVNHYYVLADLLIHHRAARFHPLTTTLGLAWMKVFSLLTPWLSGPTLLKAMFAAVGALGVWGAMQVFAALLPRRTVLLAGVLYGSSLGVWYFSAIPESKIVTATLSTLYIAAYVRFRTRPALQATIVLMAVFGLACLNEIVSAFLIAIPVVDALLQRALDWRRVRWLAGHVAVALAAWFVLEVVVNGWFIPESVNFEGQSHLNMLLYYFAKNNYGLASIHGFIANWFFFNIVAPTPYAVWWPGAGDYFEPSLAAYIASPVALATLLVVALVLAVPLLPRYRMATLGPAQGLLLPLAAFALVRAVFFFGFNPAEPLLFSPAVTLVVWLIILVPFAASRFPAKGALLSVLCVLLIATNVGFMLGYEGWQGLAARFVGP
jgi:hypothetical protein